MTDPIKAEPVAYRYAHLDYAGRKVSRYGARAERVNGHDPIEVHPLYTEAQLVEERRLAWNEAIEAALAEVITDKTIDKHGAHCCGTTCELNVAEAGIRALTKDSTHD